jgi:hypothetical protein
VSDITGIEWTDHTFNPWWGCSRVSPACRFCYADRDAQSYGHQVWRRHGPRRMLSEANWQRVRPRSSACPTQAGRKERCARRCNHCANCSECSSLTWVLPGGPQDQRDCCGCNASSAIRRAVWDVTGLDRPSGFLNQSLQPTPLSLCSPAGTTRRCRQRPEVWTLAGAGQGFETFAAAVRARQKIEVAMRKLTVGHGQD